MNSTSFSCPLLCLAAMLMLCTGCKTKKVIEMETIDRLSLTTRHEQLSYDILISEVKIAGDSVIEKPAYRIRAAAQRKDTTQQTVAAKRQLDQRQETARSAPTVSTPHFRISGFQLFLLIVMLVMILLVVKRLRPS